MAVVGTIHLPGDLKVTLDSAGVWACKRAPALAKFATLLAPAEDYSPADGRFGVRMLRDVAKRIGGKVTLEEPRGKPAPAGTVF